MSAINYNAVKFTMRLPIKITKKGKYYISSCPILDIYSQGLSKKQAEKNLSEAISLFMISCFERGTLDAVLKECGFVSISKSSKQTSRKKQADESFINVPIPLYFDKSRKAICRA